MNNKDTILEKLRENRHILGRDFNVSEIGVFGSVARGEGKDESDIDLIVEFSEPPGLFRFIELENFLSGLFGRRVDLVTKDALKPIIKDAILQESVYA